MAYGFNGIGTVTDMARTWLKTMGVANSATRWP